MRRVRVNVMEGENLLETLRSAGYGIMSMCGGRGLCGKCRVVVRSGMSSLTAPSTAENASLTEEELNSGYRLACQARSTKPSMLEVDIPPESLEVRMKLLASGLTPTLSLKPTVIKIFVKVKPPTIRDVESDLRRIEKALESKGFRRLRIGYETLKVLPEILRVDGWKVTVSIFRGREIVGVEAGDRTGECYGFAVDIGTTKISGYLVDLVRGEVAESVSCPNPQIRFGADIISRMSYAMNGVEAMDELRRCVVDAINVMVEKACLKVGCSPGGIFDFAIAGNTAMHHLFLGLPTRYLSLSPYPPVSSRGLEFEASKLGLKGAPESKAYLFPIVAGFVGGDAVADMIATRIYSDRRMSLLIDIGTNAEIILGNRDGLYACSCASGPAFEGAHIKHGMAAMDGAIEKIWIDPETLQVNYKVIGGVKPVGICGSAVVDGVAWMLRVGIIDSKGRMVKGSRMFRMKIEDGLPAIVVASKDEAGIDRDIVITQQDVREIQLAKAAVYTGISILMRRAKVKPIDVEKVYLAGAFGTFIDPESARDIGMLPEIPLGRVRFVGNTAGAGARMALISSQTRELAERILRRVKYVELAADRDFQREFVDALELPNRRRELFPTVTRIIERNISRIMRDCKPESRRREQA
ncbi:MAG: ASKHA domain-containing protein [Candidatus Bathyarchaeia archaeon]